MVKGNNAQEMVTYLGELIDGTSGVDGQELNREVGSAFAELQRFTGYKAAKLILPLIDRHQGAVHYSGPVNHLTYGEPENNPDILKSTVRLVSPFSERRSSHPLIDLSFGRVREQDDEGIIFVVAPPISDIKYSILATQADLRAPNAYTIEPEYKF
ncbi:MAG: hypothetical protein M3Q70_03185 [bacterium]|nr:hypothetical protein [bacterium]